MQRLVWGLATYSIAVVVALRRSGGKTRAAQQDDWDRNLAVERGVSFIVAAVEHHDCSMDVGGALDALQNLAYSLRTRPMALPSLRQFAARCGASLEAELANRLADVLTFKEYGEVLSDMFYVHAALGYPRKPLQALGQQVCRKIALTTIGQSNSLLRALSEVYGTPALLSEFQFSWSSERAVQQIEALEDFVINAFDRHQAGLNLNECFEGWTIPNVYDKFVNTLLYGLRPYPRPVDLLSQGRFNLLYRTLYFVTHLTYFYSGFAIRPVFGPTLAPERVFLKEALGLLLSGSSGVAFLEEIDITGEVIDCLLLLGEARDDAAILAKRQLIMRRQMSNGAWESLPGDRSDPIHATYNAINGLIEHDWLSVAAVPRGLELSLGSPMSTSEFDSYLVAAELLPSS